MNNNCFCAKYSFRLAATTLWPYQQPATVIGRAPIWVEKWKSSLSSYTRFRSARRVASRSLASPCPALGSHSEPERFVVVSSIALFGGCPCSGAPFECFKCPNNGTIEWRKSISPMRGVVSVCLQQFGFSIKCVALVVNTRANGQPLK